MADKFCAYTAAEASQIAVTRNRDRIIANRRANSVLNKTASLEELRIMRSRRYLL